MDSKIIRKIEEDNFDLLVQNPVVIDPITRQHILESSECWNKCKELTGDGPYSTLYLIREWKKFYDEHKGFVKTGTMIYEDQSKRNE